MKTPTWRSVFRNMVQAKGSMTWGERQHRVITQIRTKNNVTIYARIHKPTIFT